MQPRHTAILDIFSKPKYYVKKYTYHYNDNGHKNHYEQQTNYLTYENYGTVGGMVSHIYTTLGELKTEEDKQACVRARTSDSKQNSFHFALSGQIFDCHPYYSELVRPSAFSVPARKRIPDPAPFSLSEHIKSQNAELHRITTALLAPFEHKAGEEKANLERDKNLALALAEHNKAGFTPLHLAFKNLNDSKCREPIFNRIAAMDAKNLEIAELKNNILMAETHDQDNILHLALSRWMPARLMITLFINTFGIKAVTAAMHRTNKDGLTPLHRLCAANTSNISSGLKFILESNLIDNPAVFLLQGRLNKHNPLHLICQKKQDKKDDYELLDTLCTYLESHDNLENKDEPGRQTGISLKEQVVSATITANWNALHLACESGDSKRVTRILRNLSPEAKRDIAKAKTAQGFTALHLACRNGDKMMLKAIVEALGPEETHRIARIESSKQLSNLISENNNELGLSLADYEDTLTAELCLIEGYEYLKKRSHEWNLTQSRVNDFNNRLSDFAECLECINTDRKDLPNRRFDSQRYCCFFTSTQRYQNKRDNFQKASKTNVENFLKFLEKEQDPLAKALLKKIPQKAVAVPLVLAVPHPTDEAAAVKYPALPPPVAPHPPTEPSAEPELASGRGLGPT